MREPSIGGSSPSSRPSRVDLPLPFRPETTTRSPGPSSRSIGPSVKAPRFDDGAVQRGDPVAGPVARLEHEVELPGLERLLGPVGPLERALGLPHLAAERIRAATIGAAGLLAEPGAAAGLDAPPYDERLDLAPPLLGLLEARVGGMREPSRVPPRTR